jgi:hypothetical protein
MIIPLYLAPIKEDEVFAKEFWIKLIIINPGTIKLIYGIPYLGTSLF